MHGGKFKPKLPCQNKKFPHMETVIIFRRTRDKFKVWIMYSANMTYALK